MNHLSSYPPNFPFSQKMTEVTAMSGTKQDTDTLVLPATVQQEDLATPWNVVVYNDPVNLMSYVTMVIKRIFGYSDSKAHSMMLDVHQKGLCVVWSGDKEKAEHYVRELQGFQLMAAMKKAAD